MNVALYSTSYLRICSPGTTTDCPITFLRVSTKPSQLFKVDKCFISMDVKLCLPH
jgi:hypothetical protein